MRSIARSGVLTSMALKVSSQARAMSASKASRSAARMARIAARASSRVAASPRKNTTSATLPGCNFSLARYIDESPLAGESAQACAERLAREKALVVWRSRRADVVLGADTVVVIDDQ